MLVCKFLSSITIPHTGALCQIWQQSTANTNQAAQTLGWDAAGGRGSRGGETPRPSEGSKINGGGGATWSCKARGGVGGGKSG